MRWLSPVQMIILSVVLMVLGVVLPFLMVIKVLESTFFLNFFSYASSLIGMIMGIIGVAYYSKIFRNRNKR